MANQRGTVGGPVLTEWFAKPDLHTVDVYESLGGYSALKKVVTTMTAQQVIDEHEQEIPDNFGDTKLIRQLPHYSPFSSRSHRG